MGEVALVSYCCGESVLMDSALCSLIIYRQHYHLFALYANIFTKFVKSHLALPSCCHLFTVHVIKMSKKDSNALKTI